MADVIRVTRGDDWFYVPVGGGAHAKLCRLASKGLARPNNAEVRLVSESGPLDWDEIKQPESQSTPLAALAALLPDGLKVSPGEKICFGKHDNASSYNEFADLSLLPGETPGLSIASGTLVPGDMVLTVWPASGRIVPGKITNAGMRLAADLAEPQKKGERCFVVDEHGKAILTVSLASDGSNMVRLLPPMALDSWLFAAGSKALKSQAERFSMTHAGRRFVVTDNKSGRRYAGVFKNDPEVNPERWTLENQRVEWLLSSRGLSGILPNYQLSKDTPW
jgi:hypothetical protein